MPTDAPHSLTISEVANRFCLTQRALRYWEQFGLISPQRLGLQRLYSPAQVQRVRLIVQWQRFGLSLGEIEELLHLHRKGDMPALASRFAEIARPRHARLRAEAERLEEVIPELEREIGYCESVAAGAREAAE